MAWLLPTGVVAGLVYLYVKRVCRAAEDEEEDDEDDVLPPPSPRESAIERPIARRILQPNLPADLYVKLLPGTRFYEGENGKDVFLYLCATLEDSAPDEKDMWEILQRIKCMSVRVEGRSVFVHVHFDDLEDLLALSWVKTVRRTIH